MQNRFDLAQNWFSKADNDLRTAELILSAQIVDTPYDNACFHCQQAAEKYLKGLLIILEIPFMKTHNIEVLMDLAARKYPQIDDLSAAVALTYYAVENRYPDDYVEVNEAEVREAYRFAIAIKDFVLKAIQQDFQ